MTTRMNSHWGVHPIRQVFSRAILRSRRDVDIMNILNQRILLVEDNDDDAFFVCRALKEAGFEHEPSRVADGQQATAYLAGESPYADRSLHPLPALVLLDLQLPHRHGFDVLRWISLRPSLRWLAVVVLTNSAHSKDIGLAYKLGARSFLIKPPSAPQLKELVESLKVSWIGPE